MPVRRRLRARRHPRDDRGTTLVELVVASAVSGLMLSALYLTIWGFSDDVAVATDLADVEYATRPVMSSLVIELRQAEPGSSAADGFPVEELAADRLVFVSDRFPAYPGPERFEYELQNCAAGRCELRRLVLAADVSSVDPDYTYDDGTVVLDTVALTGVAEPGGGVDPVFLGVEYSAGARVTTDSCDRSLGSPCEFPGVALAVAVDPNPVREELRFYVVTDEVRFRNVP